ncbi:hypothetical protein TL16_g12204 [Triparma laevis f. inornata]|uniref:Uncharacterized protein n=1 Tax=Triparma laevis f. inornata TaxID=1714386 RepID=A0A9W7BK88_9STRA|nr:hypothetical protein TL16_g12204 [Triparma laevis f. inornata]
MLVTSLLVAPTLSFWQRRLERDISFFWAERATRGYWEGERRLGWEIGVLEEGRRARDLKRPGLERNVVS